MQIEKYKDFTVYKNNEKNIFIHIDIDSDDFCKKILMCFLDESKLLNYISNKTDIKFSGTKKDFVKLHKKINDFFDEENLKIDEDDLKKELENYIDWEKYDKKELLTLRRDKVGKIGEYIFHNILIDYFDSLCIVPKLNLTTNRNMSIYGIDVIFYNPSNNTLMFGESKVSKSLDNGISLVNDSLKNYEHQIFEEYRAILSSDVINISNLPKELKKYIDTCIDYIISLTMRLKSSYVENEFYSMCKIICYFLKCDKVSEREINIIISKIISCIDYLYFSDSKCKKILKEIGIYDYDIDKIIDVIGEDTEDITEIIQLLKDSKFHNLSYISQYIINRL